MRSRSVQLPSRWQESCIRLSGGVHHHAGSVINLPSVPGFPEKCGSSITISGAKLQDENRRPNEPENATTLLVCVEDLSLTAETS